MSQKVCVVLSGCGFLDGAEVHESVVTLLALSKAGAKYTVAAPHKKQMHVVNHHTQQVEAGAERHVHVEARRNIFYSTRTKNIEFRYRNDRN